MTLCMHRDPAGPYYCVSTEDHEGEHNMRNARVIVRDLEAQRDYLYKLKLSDIEKTALSRAIHFRIPALQRAKQELGDDNDVGQSAEDQIQALFRIATRHEVP